MTNSDSTSPDAVGKLLADMGEVQKDLPKIKSELKSLKARAKKLDDHLDSIEYSGFQEQILNLDKSVKNQENALLETQRFVARLYVDERLGALTEIILNQRKAIPFSDKESLHNQLINNASHITGKIADSTKPLSLGIKFNIDAQKYLEERGYEFIKIP